MNAAYHILGHGNFALSIIIDTLLAAHGEEVHVFIVSNLPVEADDPYSFDGEPNLRITEVSSDGWDGHWENLLIGVLQTKTKRIVLESFHQSHGVRAEDFGVLVHPSAVIAKKTKLQPGVQVGPSSVVAPYTTVGHLTTINRKVSVGHHTTIGGFCTLNPGCNIAGKCRIEDNVTIGMGANVVDRTSIGENTIVGAGSVVTKSLPANVAAWGVPAKVMKSFDDP